MRSEDVRYLYGEHGKELQRYLARKIRCRFTAADLTQDLFVKLLRSKKSDALDNPRAYLFRMAANMLADHARSAATRNSAAHEPLGDRVVETKPGPEDTLVSRDELMRLQRAVAELPDRQREVITLHKYQGLSYQEIADQLGISKNTVMVHMMRALAHCRDRMAQD